MTLIDEFKLNFIKIVKNILLCNYVIYQLGGPDRNILSRYCAVSNGDKTKQTKIFEKYSFYFRKITIA